MKRTKINQIFAGLALFAIFFGVVSTAVMIIVSPETPSQTTTSSSSVTGLEQLLKEFSWSVQVVTWSTSTGTQTLTWTTKK